ncbi:MAG TPA: hypothetical protein VK906_01690 [Egicoccus sp.]|nr:hypothetical protein [Egicoccus sp.]HSK21853.1 hypothetical protein [Egicoccus sp.]
MSTGVPVTGRGRLLRRIILLASGSILSMALGFAALTDAVDLFGGSGSPSDDGAIATAPAADDADTGASGATNGGGAAGGEPTAGEQPDELTDGEPSAGGQGVYHSRDPFAPVVTEEIADVTSAANQPVSTAPPVTDPEPETAAPPTTTVAEGPDETTEPAAPTSGCVADAEAYVCDGVYVSLVNVGTDATGVLRAVIQLDTTVYEVVDGVALPGGFVVTRVGSSCVDLRYGAQDLQICESDRALK